MKSNRTAEQKEETTKNEQLLAQNERKQIKFGLPFVVFFSFCVLQKFLAITRRGSRWAADGNNLHKLVSGR